MNKVKIAIAPSDDDSKLDQFKPVMTKFYQANNPKVQQLLKDLRDAEAEADKAAVKFGEPPGQTQWEAFFQIFKEFMDLWKDGEANIQKAKDAAIKEEKRKAAEEKTKKVTSSYQFRSFISLTCC